VWRKAAIKPSQQFVAVQAQRGNHTQWLLLEKQKAGIEQLEVLGQVVELFDGILA
jgi:hypothetical protein